MPCYLYKNPLTGEVKEVIQSIHQKHEYFENGIEFERIFTIPNASVDTKIDPNSAKDFVEKTGRKKGTLGDIWDASKECAEKRGENPYSNWSKKRKGKKHPNVKRQEAKNELSKLGFDVS